MLHEIHIQNYAVIDNLTVEFRAGLNLLSGETGSGKSILVDALGLALGGRASSDVIRTGADRASVTAVFRSNGTTPWATWLEQYGLAGGEEPELILRREIQASGKSRLLVNDQPVTLAAVRDLARLLVEVHGQNEHVALFSREAQLGLLDRFTGVEELLETLGELYTQRRNLARDLAGLNQNEQERLRTIDLLQFQVQELERAAIEPGEDASLEAEKQVLANLERIRAAATTAFSELYEEDGSASARLAGVTRALEELRRYDSTFENYSESLAAARAAVDDLAFFLQGYLGKLEADPGRLEGIEDRLALLDRLKRKYGGTIEGMLSYLESTRQQLANLEHADERRVELSRSLELAAADYKQAADLLSVRRRAAAKKLQNLVAGELGQLGMEKTRFEIHFENRNSKSETRSDGGSAESLSSSPASNLGDATGIDEIEFLISPNPGEELRALEKIASGGELSRLMLALKTAVGQSRTTAVHAPELESGKRHASAPHDAPTFVFDEVDAGIGGRVAESVGQRLKRLASETQVLCVTHLPQIACFADHHFYVQKLERLGRTITTVEHLVSHKQRVAELARMLSGSQITDAVLEHAAVMLKQGAA